MSASILSCSICRRRGRRWRSWSCCLRSSTGSARLLSLAAVALATIATVSVDPVSYWGDRDKEDASKDGFAISQEVFEAQAPLLDEQLEALKPQRPGIVDMYSITFAPYEGQEVFRRESAMVTEVMEKRFDTAGRSLQLINHRDTADTLPWATPLNLQRAHRRHRRAHGPG